MKTSQRAADAVTAACFGIARRSSIPSDGTEHKVQVTQLDLRPAFEHKTVPSKTQSAYLTAKVKNTTKFPLLPGPTAIYLDGSFVAKSHLESVSSEEEFTCSLGVDPAVKIEYKPMHKFNEQSGNVLTGKNTHETREQHIEIKNSRPDKIKLILLEQVPKSTEERIKVHLEQPDLGAKNGGEVKLDKDHNLEWIIEMAANQKKDFLIKWRVEYPINEKIEFHN